MEAGGSSGRRWYCWPAASSGWRGEVADRFEAGVLYEPGGAEPRVDSYHRYRCYLGAGESGTPSVAVQCYVTACEINPASGYL